MRSMGQSAPGRVPWGTLLWILILVAAAYGALRLVPAYVDVYRFEDAVKEMTLGVSSYTQRVRVEQSLRDEILRLAAEYEIDLPPQDIQFTWYPNRLIIEVLVARDVRLPGYLWRIRRHVRAERQFF